MFQPLPLPAIEQLARGLEPLHLPAGQAVFRQGDPADRFYLIEAGAAGYSVFSGTTIDRTSQGHQHVVGDARCRPGARR